jgi:hypothetical protein
MAGTVQRWTPERLGWLAACVVEHIKANGRVDWATLAAQAGTTVNGVRFAFQGYAQAGQVESIPVLRARFLAKPDPVSAPPRATVEQEVETKTTESGLEARAHGTTIRTVDDLLRHIEADLTRYEIDRCEATKYEQASKGPDGEPNVTELHRVFVKLKPKAGPTTQEVVETMIAAAFAKRRPLPVPRKRLTGDADLLHAVVIADPHIGKHAWGKETGWGDYDTGIAVALLAEAAADLLARGDAHRPGRRALWLLGDLLHVDTVQGTTTRGTPQDRDTRIPKMIDEGARVLFDVIDRAAETAPVDVVLVPGNHDHVLSWALQRLLVERYRTTDRVTVDGTYTQRKYVRFGKCLFGLTHGDKARKKLPQLMARERPVDWGETRLREIHTGHLHETAAIQTIDGVITRTAPSLSAPDAWHAEEGYVGSLRAMEGFLYHAAGEMVGMDVASPKVAA